MRVYLKILFTVLVVLTTQLFSADIWSGYVDVKSDYIVNSGEILEVLPGTVVRFAPDARLIVEGQLKAEGTESEQIRFTSFEPESNEADFWNGIIFSLAEKDTSTMAFCEIDNIKKYDTLGSIHITGSLVRMSNCHIHDNSGYIGGAIHVDGSGFNLVNSVIENNEALIQGGGIYISNDYDKFNRAIIVKNVIKDNFVSEIADPERGGGGICVYEVEPYSSYVLISENDIISNYTKDSREALAGSGGGVLITTQNKYEIEFTGNNVMYNKSQLGGGLAVVHVTSKDIPYCSVKNNIISNNTSDDYSGGIYYNTGDIINPDRIFFYNNTVVNNLNLALKEGAGGLYIKFNSDLGNYFEIKNCIFWNNYNNTTLLDIKSYPSYYPGNYVLYSNTTTLLEGQGNISKDAQFFRSAEIIGAEPYENYKRGDYHLSLESPCVDAGDPKMESVEPDGTYVNMGAWGNTNEATTSKYTTVDYENGVSVSVKTGETYKLDCSRETKAIYLSDISVEDGGQIFVKTAPESGDPNIYISSLVTQGKKIGDLYTTRIQRMTTAQQGELPYNILNIGEINCTGAEFNNMSVKVDSGNESVLNDSHIYIDEYDSTLTGVSINAPKADITNTTIDNFGTGIYFGSPVKGIKARTARISNNTISFDAAESNKGNTKAKGIVVENGDAEVTDNNIDNPNEGVEAASSSGRISNNTVSFDASESNKAGTDKKAIYLYGGSNCEVDHNNIYCDDNSTLSISAVEVEDSYINAYYNIINFGSGYDSKLNRFGFYTYNLLENSIFINNTVYYSNYGMTDNNSKVAVRLFNNIFYTPTLTYITSNSSNLVLYNNDLQNEYEINWEAVKDEKNTLYGEPDFQSTKVNDFYLWYESKCINAGLYMEEYHTYGVNYYGEAPDIGAVEFYEKISLSAPSNLAISATSTNVYLTWSAVTNASSYKVYRSADPYPSDWGLPIETTTANYITLSTGSTVKYFYRVTASTDTLKDQPAEYSDSATEKLTQRNYSAKKIIIKESNILK